MTNIIPSYDDFLNESNKDFYHWPQWPMDLEDEYGINKSEVMSFEAQIIRWLNGQGWPKNEKLVHNVSSTNRGLDIDPKQQKIAAAYADKHYKDTDSIYVADEIWQFVYFGYKNFVICQLIGVADGKLEATWIVAIAKEIDAVKKELGIK